MGTHPIFESDFDCLTEMWRAQAGQVVNEAQNDSDDDWETEADYENQVGDTEQMKQARSTRRPRTFQRASEANLEWTRIARINQPPDGNILKRWKSTRARRIMPKDSAANSGCRRTGKTRARSDMTTKEKCSYTDHRPTTDPQRNHSCQTERQI